MRIRLGGYTVRCSGKIEGKRRSRCDRPPHAGRDVQKSHASNNIPKATQLQINRNLINIADEIQQSPVARMSKNAGYITLITFDACG